MIPTLNAFLLYIVRYSKKSRYKNTLTQTSWRTIIKTEMLEVWGQGKNSPLPPPVFGRLVNPSQLGPEGGQIMPTTLLLVPPDFWTMRLCRRIGVKYNEKLAVRRPQTSWRLTNLTLFLKSAFLRLRPCWVLKILIIDRPQKTFFIYIVSSDILRENFSAMEYIYWGRK